MRAANYQLSFGKDMERPQDYASDGLDAIGFIHFWGISPATDLLGDFTDVVPQPVQDDPEGLSIQGGSSSSKCSASSTKKDKKSTRSSLSLDDMLNGVTLDSAAGSSEPKLGEDEDYYNILISGGADLRHVIKTVAKWHLKKSKKKLRFFLHDQQVEVTARHLLFLQILTNTDLTPRDRAELFLTLYGNALVRDRDSKYLSDQVKRLLKVASESSAAKNDFLSELVDFSCLKFKDRDAFEAVLQGWKADVPFDVEKLRDDRLRGHYRARYEWRKNLLDGHYQTNIKPIASIIHWYHYRDFGHTGVAFESRLGSYSVPNRTLASYIDGKSREKGTSILVRGFWADIVNGPYFAFGTDVHNPRDKVRLFKRSQEQHRNTAVDVSEFNLEAWIREMQTFEEFNLPPEKPEEAEFPFHASAMDDLRAGNRIEEVDADGKVKEPEKPEWAKKKRLPAMEGCKVVLLTGDLEENLKKSKYEQAFDRVFFGNMAVLPVLEASGMVGSAAALADEEKKANKKDAETKEESQETTSASSTSSTTPTTNHFARSLKPQCVVTCESMKYQVHFEARMKLGFRRRMREAFEKLGMEMHRADRLPNPKDVIPESRAREIEFSLPNFVHFAPGDVLRSTCNAGAGGGQKSSSRLDELDFD
ncbi:unnamed protein product [Amoebophrya sp. A25]|nr:unnamed protein product [Amoebophrya sp. A25]|eukprot:GSA25T00007388001.1